MNIEKEKLYNEAKALITRDVDTNVIQSINEAKNWVGGCRMYVKSIYGKDSVEYQKFIQIEFKPKTVPLLPNIVNQIRLTVLLNGIEQALVDIFKLDISEWSKGKRLISCSCGLKGKKTMEVKTLEND